MWQTAARAYNKRTLSVGVDSKMVIAIVIFIVIVLGVNRPLV